MLVAGGWWWLMVVADGGEQVWVALMVAGSSKWTTMSD
jgi:hypothetical protein